MLKSMNEVVKSFLKEPKEIETTSYVSDQNVNIALGDEHENTGIFFDETNTVFGFNSTRDVLSEQRTKIQKYRQLAMEPTVDEAIDIITNEIIYSYKDDLPITLQVDLENEKLNKVLQEKFDKIAQLANLNRNFYQIVKRTYIDGQVNMHTPYDAKKPKEGIQAINMIEPQGLYYDSKREIWCYEMERSNFSNASNINKEVRISPEELVHENFGLYDGELKLSYLEYAIKSSNMLKTLEDLLIPLRFSRSISRRVFNVDIGDLPPKRGSEVMNEHQRKFKYRKFYNNETGEVSNQQHITSMVEDYWFANRSGGKGTTVDLLDETGNLGELDDILYFNNKLYRSLKIPSNRVPGSDRDNEFDYDTSRTTKEDMQFFMFISRLRKVFSSLFKEILRREVISTGIMTPKEWEQNESSIKIIFIEDNAFIEKMNLQNFMSRLDIYSTAQEYKGKLFSVETILKEIFSMSDQDIVDEQDRIEAEMKNPKYTRFYETDGEY